MLRFLIIGYLIAFAGCKYPALPALGDASPGGPCTQSSACKSQSPNLPVCDLSLNGGTCVACTSVEHDLCTNNTPHCDRNMCVACTEDVRDCGAGGICLPNGACAGPSSIIHANANGSSDPDCGDASKPCTLDRALTVITASGKSVIKLDNPGPYIAFSTNNFIVDANVTLDMRGAILHRIADGPPILEIKASKTVAIMGGTIEDSKGDGILCSGNLTLVGTNIRNSDRAAINMAGGCNLVAIQLNVSTSSIRGGTSVAAIVDNGDSITISRSTIAANHGGGIAINSGTFKVVGNALLNNGDNMSATGGILISATQNTDNHLDFNTISGNTIQDGTRSGGIDCNVGGNFVGRYNIFWSNKSNTIGTASQISGGCKFIYSDSAPEPILAIHSTGTNLNMDPMLMNETTDPRLKMGSPAIGYADPMADLTGLASIDINGDTRVKRSGKGADIGADQYTP